MARILLVDDDHDIRVIGRELLLDAGHFVFTADGALAALEVLRDHRIDLLLTDANMPNYSGFDLIRTIKKDERHRDLVIAMLTGRREKKDILRAVELGVNDYIVKPIDPVLFLHKVEDLLQRLQKRPSSPGWENEFATLKLQEPAKVTTSAEIVSLSESGLSLRSQTSYLTDTTIQVDSDLYAKIGIEAPLLRVLSCARCKDDAALFEIRAAFVGADERSLMKIRAWVHAGTIKGRKVS